MDVYDAIQRRHSYREFDGEPVERDTIERLIAATSAAPSAGNAQPAFIHVTTGGTRDEIIAAMSLSTVHLDEYIGVMPEEHLDAARTFFAWLGDAPVIAVVSCPTPGNEMDRMNTYVSVGCAIENLLLAATAEGLGCCNVSFAYWVRDDLARIVGLEPDREVVSIVLIGHPVGEPAAPPHRTGIAVFLD